MPNFVSLPKANFQPVAFADNLPLLQFIAEIRKLVRLA